MKIGNRSLTFIVAGAFASVAAGAAAYGQSLPPEASNPAVRAAAAACTKDISTFCASVTPGGGRIVRCLVAHQDELSPACRAGILKAKTALGR